MPEAVTLKVRKEGHIEVPVEALGLKLEQIGLIVHILALREPAAEPWVMASKTDDPTEASNYVRIMRELTDKGVVSIQARSPKDFTIHVHL